MKTTSWQKYLGVVAFVLSLVLSYSSAHATLIRFEYDGNEFDTHTNGYFPANDRFTGFIDVEPDQLGGSLANKVFGNGLAIPTWSITDGTKTVNQFTTAGTTTFLGFVSDGSGNIVDWFFHVGSFPDLLTSRSNTTEILDAIFGAPTGFIPFGDKSADTFLNRSASNTNPGTWTRVVEEDEITIPEPATLGMFVIGLAGLAVMTRRRRWDRKSAD